MNTVSIIIMEILSHNDRVFRVFVSKRRWIYPDRKCLISMESQWSTISQTAGRGFRTFRPGQMIYLSQHTQKQVSAHDTVFVNAL